MKEAMDSIIEINMKKTLFNMSFPPIIPIDNLGNVCPWVNSMGKPLHK